MNFFRFERCARTSRKRKNPARHQKAISFSAYLTFDALLHRSVIAFPPITYGHVSTGCIHFMNMNSYGEIEIRQFQLSASVLRNLAQDMLKRRMFSPHAILLHVSSVIFNASHLSPLFCDLFIALPHFT